VSYQFRAVEEYWKNFCALTNQRKELVREKWKIFKANPFDPSLGTHKIERLSALYRHTIYSVVIEKSGDLRVLFRIDGDVITTLDVGTHELYK
jgi:Txe/YoeB family toxin of Txe-Axe toxin-antitoxin module